MSKRLSVGRSGSVYEGTDLKLARHLVLKTLRPPATGYAPWRDRILTKVRTLASLEHPNVVAIHDYAELGDDAGLCLVSEKLKGHSAAYHLDRSGRYDLRVAARVTLQAAYALALLRHEQGLQIAQESSPCRPPRRGRGPRRLVRRCRPG